MGHSPDAENERVNISATTNSRLPRKHERPLVGDKGPPDLINLNDRRLKERFDAEFAICNVMETNFFVSVRVVELTILWFSR
jgi:hypothetical protein